MSHAELTYEAVKNVPYTQPNTACAYAPSFATWGNKGYMFWGHSDDRLKYRLYYAAFNPQTQTFEPQRYVYNTDPSVDGLYKTFETPGAAVLHDTPLVAWHLHGTSDLYYSLWKGTDEPEGQRWSPAKKLSDQATIKDYTSPVLVSYKQQIMAIWSDYGTKAPDVSEGHRNGIWYSLYDPASDTWQEMRKIPGVSSNQTPAVTVFQERIWLTWCGYHGGEPLFMASFDHETGWTAQTRLDGTGSSEAPALAVADQTLYLFWRNDGDRRVYYWTSSDGQTWQKDDGKQRLEIDSHRGVGAMQLNGRMVVGWNQDWKVRYLIR